MTRRDTSIDGDYFENLYRTDPDPWGFRTSEYERDKYAATLAALGQARQLCAAQRHVRFELRMVPDDFPVGSFDLIVLSEVIYYLDRADLRRLASQCASALAPHGEIITCHWLGETDYPLTGAEASDLFADTLHAALPTRAILTDEVYRLERLTRA